MSGKPLSGYGEILFSFEIDPCLLTSTTGQGDPAPVHTMLCPAI